MWIRREITLCLVSAGYLFVIIILDWIGLGGGWMGTLGSMREGGIRTGI